MYKPAPAIQTDLFSSSSNFLNGRSLVIFNKKESWHHQFRTYVTNRIDESIFKELFCSNNGTPNSSIRVLIGMMILKESQGLCNQKIFKESRFNTLTRSALGLVNADDSLPTESTYYAFRSRIVEHEKKNGAIYLM